MVFSDTLLLLLLLLLLLSSILTCNIKAPAPVASAPVSSTANALEFKRLLLCSYLGPHAIVVSLFHLEKTYSDEEEEGCCVSCIKRAVGFFSWNVIKDKFFSEEDPSPYQYDPGTDVYGDYAQQGGSNFMVQPPNMAGIESNNPHPGKVHEVHSEQELHQILTTRTAMLSLMFYQSHCGYCHQIDPIYKQLATIFPQSSFLKVNLDVVDMDGEIDSVPTFYFFCEVIAVAVNEDRKCNHTSSHTTVVGVCGQNMAARAVAMQNMPPPPQSRDPPPPAHKYQQLQMILDEQPYDSIRSPESDVCHNKCYFPQSRQIPISKRRKLEI
eukprot:jgi/Bigna1/70757/fgenesh1_pg.13_\